DLHHGGDDTAESRGARLSLTAAGREPTERAADFSSWWPEERDHEVSILMSRTGAVVPYRGERPRAKTSMTNIGPPQHGHARRDAFAVESAAGVSSAGWGGGGTTPSK